MKFKQRPILYRVWDGENLFYSDDLTKSGLILNVGYAIPLILNTSRADIYCEANFIFTQFTGLKDKYGKKIFEGDIVKILSWDKAEDDEPADSFFIDVVCFKNANFTLQKESHYTLSEWNKPRKFKIIGNIFENPELLK